VGRRPRSRRGLIAAGATRWSSLRPLRHRDFALIWSAALVSNVGNWMQTVAVGTLVTELTGRASGAGFIAAAGFLPIGLVSPIGGAIADRVDRRRFLMVTTAGETAAAVALALIHATGHATPLTVAAPVFAGGAIAALGFPCYQAMLPDLVGADDLLGAVSLSSAQFNLGRVVGPALAGLVIHFGSYTWAFAANAASFAAVLVALGAVRVASPQPAAGTSVRAQIRDGVRAARDEPGCRRALQTAFVMALCASPFIALVPAFAVVLFHGDAGTTSLLVAAQGIGAVAGALAMTPLAARVGRDRALAANLVLLPVTLGLYAATPNAWSAAAALVLVGAAYIGVFSGLNTLIQLRAPAAFRGRILSLYFVVVGVVYPLGAALQGRAADVVGLRATTAGGAAVMLAVLALFRPRLSFAPTAAG
jgi:MFS family permease